MALMFQSIFTFAHIPMDAIQAAVDWLGNAGGPERFRRAI